MLFMVLSGTLIQALHFNLQHVDNTYVIGKLTIVGFFSTKKLFLVNLLMQKMRYGGSLVSWNLLRKFSL